MADIIATICEGMATQTADVSMITTVPMLTHQRDLLKRAASIDSATCGWANADYNDALVCGDPYHQPCLWNSDLHVVGCCADAGSAGCAWKTSCVPYSSINYGCDSSCQSNSYNLLCPSDRGLCAMATFAGPSGYSYYSCTDKYPTTETVYLTWKGGDATVQDLPRYYASYWAASSSSASTSTGTTKSSGTSTKSSTTATATSQSSTDKAVSWISKYKWPVIGAVVGALILVILLIACCACRMRRKRTGAANRGVYVPASQHVPTQEAVPLTGYQPYTRQQYSNP